MAAVRLSVLGGKERDCAAIGRQLQARGHDVCVVTTEAAIDPRLPVVVLPAGGRSNHARAASFARALASARTSLSLDRVIAFDKLPGADLYYACDVCFAARKLGFRRALPRYRALLTLERGVFGTGAPTRILYLTRAEREQYEAVYGADPGRRGTILPVILHEDRLHFACPDIAERVSVRRSVGVPDGGILAVSVATNPWLKGLDRSLAALREIPRITLAVVGSDDEGIARQARQLGVAERVRVFGYERNIMRLIAISDLMLHPARVDVTGSVIIEGLLAGVPVCASAACGYAPEIDESGAGAVIAEPFSQLSYVSKIRYIIDNIEEMKEAAKSYADNLASRESWLDAVIREIER